MSNEELVTEVKALDIQPGNFVVLRVDARATPEGVQPLVESVRHVVPQDCTIAVLVGDADISALTEESMRAQGWVRQLVIDELVAAFEEVLRISDRKHDAWDRAKEAIAAAKGAV